MSAKVGYCVEVDKILLVDKKTTVVYPVTLVTRGDIGDKYFSQHISVPTGKPYRNATIAVWRIRNFDIYDENKRFKRAKKYWIDNPIADDFEMYQVGSLRYNALIDSSVIFRRYRCSV